MVNAVFTPLTLMASQSAGERTVILSYAPACARAGLEALFALDDTLGGVLRTTSQPMVGQMRMTWWHDALTRLDSSSPPAEPVLVALAAHVLPLVSGVELTAIVEGWEELLEPGKLDARALDAYAQGRGALFPLAGRILGAGASDPLIAAGQGWALADLARHESDAMASRQASERAAVLLAEATRVRWSRAGRAMGAMAHLARLPDAAPPRRVARALWHRLTGN